MICSAKSKSSGKRCKAHAISGGTVCRVHGGAAPQVIAAAHARILRAADPVAARMIQIALSRKTKPADAIAIGRDLLTRAGAIAGPGASGADDGSQVLWDEFIQIHRRRVGRDAESEPVREAAGS